MHIELGTAPEEKIIREEQGLQHTEQPMSQAKLICLNTAVYTQQINDPVHDDSPNPLQRKFNPLLFLWNWAHTFMSTIAHMLH